MSYDIWLEADLGGTHPVQVGDLDWNYTSNVAPMWRKAMPETNGLAGLDGLYAFEASLALTAGISNMEEDPDSYRAMNPKNGWGDFDHQLECLRELHAALAASPRAKVVVSR